MSPPKKVRKTDDGKMKRTPDGVIRFDVDKISTLGEYEGGEGDEGRYSSDVKVRELPWHLNIWRVDDSLKATLHIGPVSQQLSPWTIEGSAEFTLVNSDCSKNMIFENNTPLNNEDKSWTVNLVDWETLIDCKRGFVKDDKITVEARFWIERMNGIKRLPLFYFNDPNDPCHDVKLVIEGRKLYVSKQILAVQSPVFKAMFYGEFAEKNMKKIELPDVNIQEFFDMLLIIYPSSSEKITVDNAEYLLKLGDRFDIAHLIDRVEDFLVNSSKIPNIEKLRIADKYRLFGLQEQCFSALTTIKDFKDIEESPIFDGLSEATVRLLFKRRTNIQA